MKDHQAGCTILTNGICTCLDTGELQVLRKAKDKLDINYVVLAHHYRWLKVAFWILLSWFFISVVFNIMFIYDLWFIGGN